MAHKPEVVTLEYHRDETTKGVMNGNKDTEQIG